VALGIHSIKILIFQYVINSTIFGTPFALIPPSRALNEDKDMNKRGITLIELVIVLVIIGIGAALMVPGFGAWIPITGESWIGFRENSPGRAVSNNMRYGVALIRGQHRFQLYQFGG
jgi:prepilin-type N-terminal cleavage/methylation domain-containing protein